MELRERVCSNYFTCCFHLFEKQPITKFPCTSFTGPHNSVLFRGRTWASIVKALTKRCWSIPRREAWAKGKGRYTFNTGGYCPIELSCSHQSSFLRLDFFLIPCVTCNRLLRRFTALLLYLEHGVLALDMAVQPTPKPTCKAEALAFFYFAKLKKKRFQCLSREC